MTLTFSDLVLELTRLGLFVLIAMFVIYLMLFDYPRFVDWLIQRRRERRLRTKSTPWMDGLKHAELVLETNPGLAYSLRLRAENQFIDRTDFDRGILAYINHREKCYALDHHA